MLLILLLACPRPPVDTGEPGPPPLDPALTDAIDAEMASLLHDADMPAITIGLSMPGFAPYEAAYGVADLGTGAGATAETAFRIGSVTKPLVATVALLLVEEGRLSLDAPLATWFPQVPNASGITVRHLLSHTSGLADYAATDLYDDRATPHTADEIVAVIAGLAPLADPGVEERYSNSNYFLLGLVLEEAGGAPAAELLRDRLWAPLGRSRSFLEDLEPMEGPLARGYTGLVAADVTDAVDQTNNFTAGGVVSTGGDVAAWGAALLAGELLEPATREAMFTPVTLAGGDPAVSGLGLLVGIHPELGLVLNHTGGVDGFTANVYLFADHGIAFASAQNHDETDPKAPFRAIADLVFPEL